MVVAQFITKEKKQEQFGLKKFITQLSKLDMAKLIPKFFPQMVGGVYLQP